MRSQQQTRIPLRMAILNLVHELMHAFGYKLLFLHNKFDLILWQVPNMTRMRRREQTALQLIKMIMAGIFLVVVIS
jgi:hypothetical protein